MNAGGVDDGLYPRVSQGILGAQVLSQVDEQLPAEYLIAMHVANELDLRLHLSMKTRGKFGENRHDLQKMRKECTVSVVLGPYPSIHCVHCNLTVSTLKT